MEAILQEWKDEKSKYLFTDVACCTFTFSDGLTSKIDTSPKNDLILLRLFSRISKSKQFEDSVLANYMSADSVSELAELCGYGSLKTFTRHFKKYFGETPYQWMIDCKLEEVRALVLWSGMSISKISLTYGFKNVSHLVSIYTRKFGISPLKDRLKESRESIDLIH